MMRAIRGSTSSAAYVSPIRSENSDSTSYGVARLPYTSRFAKRCARRRIGWKATATTAAATADRTTLGRSPPPPRNRIGPTASAMYTAVMKTAITPKTTVLLMTRSTSYRRYLRIAIAEATGISGKVSTWS
jgi:hypothetical protein